jgi:hypothetical protein
MRLCISIPDTIGFHEAMVDPTASVSFIHYELLLAKLIRKTTPEVGRTANHTLIHRLDFVITGSSGWANRQSINVEIGNYYDPPEQLILSPADLQRLARPTGNFANLANTSAADITARIASMAPAAGELAWHEACSERIQSLSDPCPLMRLYVSIPTTIGLHEAIVDPTATISYIHYSLPLAKLIMENTPEVERTARHNLIHRLDFVITGSSGWANHQSVNVEIADHDYPRENLMLSPDFLQRLARPTGNPADFQILQLHTQGYFNKRTNCEVADVRNHSVPFNPITYQALEPLRAQYAARASSKAAGIAHPRAYDQWALQFPFDPGITLHTCSTRIQMVFSNAIASGIT